MKGRYWTLMIICIGLFVLFAVSPGSALAWNTNLQPAPTYGAFLPYAANMPTPTPLPTPTATPISPPPASPAYYMTTVDSTMVVNEGCLLGKRDLSLPGVQDSVVVLDFGYPQKYANGTFGARGFANPPKYTNIDQITAAVKNFGVGYVNCSLNEPGSHLRIGIGTSNWPGDAYSSVSKEHGVAWGNMVNAINDWFTTQCQGTSCQGRVDIVGANDIELGWNAYTPTKNWLDGYASVAKYQLYNYGSLDGCPYIGVSWTGCGTSSFAWTRDQVLFVIWGSPPVQPMPEIYLENGVNADQWYLMSVYSYNKNKEKIQFIGPMTQRGACTQRGGCSKMNNSPAAGWWQLYNLLNGDTRTAGEQLRYPTDIKYLGE